MPQGNVPSGTVTFLFTDIEGSTKLWDAHPESMRDSLARHDAIMRDAILAYHGYVFKTIGDAFCAAFGTASEAIEAALTAQLSLTSEIWPTEISIKVRMAVHTGAVESRDSDYFGPPVNRVARLLNTTHGGQIVLSAPTQELVRDSLPGRSKLKDLGSHQLKDLARPEQVYQIVHPDLPADFPAIRSLSNYNNNLPQQLTSFIGREKETEELLALIQRSRLVTLTGSGGTGKSRLSLQLAADSLDQFPDGAWLVELAPLTNPDLVASTVATIMGLRDETDSPMTQALATHLKDKHLLLLLDNCEHLLDATAKLVDAILKKCPKVTVLATSREGLGISGETTYRVPSLSLPDVKTRHTLESLSHFEAVRLFIDRAVQVQSTFEVTNQNAPALASICLRLDGIPLAIELAAVRVRSLTVDDINAKLDQRFRLLTGGSRTALPRQQTIRSLIDWSYDLLSDAEKTLLCRLSVFTGGWSLEAAETVCSGGQVEEWDILDLLTSLFDKSLIVVEHSKEETRYNLLETIRQYARDRLYDSGTSVKLRNRHLDSFLALAEEARPHLRGPQQAMWLGRLETEHDNMRSALSWSDESQDNASKGLRLAAALWRFWLLRGHITEGRQWLDKRLADDPRTEPEVRARALNGAGNLAEIQTDFVVSQTLHLESLAISKSLNDQWFVAMSLNNLGNGFASQGDFTTASDYWTQSLDIWRSLQSQNRLGDRRGIAATVDNLGNAAFSRGDYSKAKTHYEECLTLRREMGNESGIAFSLVNLASLAYTVGDHQSARDHYRESLVKFIELGDPVGVSCGLEGLAWPGPPTRAATLWGAAERIRDELGTPLTPVEQAEHEKVVNEARKTQNDDQAFDEAWALGKTLSQSKAVELALDLERESDWTPTLPSG